MIGSSPSPSPSLKRIGIVGARGHTGAEMVRLLAAHPGFELAFVTSRELAGQPLSAHVDGYQGPLLFSRLEHEDVASAGADAVVLALPNDKSAPIVAAIDAMVPGTVIVDLSADHRFDAGWHYGLPELTRVDAAGRTRIANPGCYATAMQLAIAPVADRIVGPVQCFGVSGYSGAGTTSSDRNDPGKLRDNLMPYALAGHMHEREVAHRLGLAIEFMPHVAPHFRGLTITANLHLRDVVAAEDIAALYAARYAGEPLVEVTAGAPWVSRIAHRHGVQVGGVTVGGDGRRVVVVATLDNLLKGAATQALQNLNLAFGFDELEGVPR